MINKNNQINKIENAADITDDLLLSNEYSSVILEILPMINSSSSILTYALKVRCFHTLMINLETMFGFSDLDTFQ